MSLFRSDYRDHTLYDFSNIVKAKLFVFKINHDGSTSSCKDILPFQINPSDYNRVSDSIHMKDPDQLDINGIDALANHENDDGLGIDTLKFNIFDEYNAQTMNGTLPIPVNINKITIIDKLFKYANRDYVAIFQWADRYVVRINNVRCTYTSFSKFGEPLTADVRLNFTNECFYQHLLNDASVKFERKFDVSTVTAMSVLEEGASDFLPSIISKKRGG